MQTLVSQTVQQRADPIEYQIQGQDIRILDLPGFLCGNDKYEVVNHAKSMKLLTKTKSESKTTITTDSRVFYCYPAAEIRMVGTESIFKQSLRILKSYKLVNANGSNLVVLITNTNASTTEDLKDFIRGAITSGFRTDLCSAGEESVTFPIIFTGAHTGYEDEKKDLFLRKALEGVGLPNLEGECVPQKICEEPTPEELHASSKFLQEQHLVSRASDNEEDVPAFEFALLGKGFDVSDTNREIIDLGHQVQSMTEVYLGGKKIRIPKPFSCTREAGLSFRQCPVESIGTWKPWISWHTFHLRLYTFEIESPEELYSSCNATFKLKLNALHAEEDGLEPDPKSFFNKWGTHLVRREDYGGVIEIMIVWSSPIGRYYSRDSVSDRKSVV